MSEQYPGGFITKSPPTPAGPYENSSGYGIWNLSQQAAYKAQGLWPTAGNQAPDAQFNYVTMLLHGDGTNGAQNNTFLDSSTNNFTITRNGNTTQGSFSPYGSNWSNFFSYNSTAANYLVTSSVSLSGTFTIEGYVYWDGVGSNATMFTLGDSALSTGVEISIASGNWSVFSESYRITGAAAVKGQWTYISISRTGSTVTMYINGASQGTWTSSATFSGTMKIGAEYYASTYYSSMSGYISNFRVNNTTAINTVPTAPLTAVSGTILLTCQSNRFVDTSASPLTITVTGTPSVQRFNPFGTSTAYSTATIGGSGYFLESSSSYIQTTSSATIGSGNFTVEGWFYRTSTSRIILASIGDENTSTGGTFYIDGSTGYYNLVTNGSVISIATSPPANTVNCWTHFAFVRSGSTVTCYINGVSGGTNSNSSSFSGLVTLGAEIYNGTTYAGTTGYVANVRITTTAVYTSTFTPPSAPVTAISGTQFLCNMTNGAIYDNAMMNDLETVGNAQISTSVKKYGTGSMYFDGTGDVCTIASNPWMNLGVSNWTIEFWVYANSTSRADVVSKGNSSTYVPYLIQLSGGQISLYFSDNGIGYSFTLSSSAGAYTTGNWVHVAVVRNGNTMTIYSNGTSVGSNTYSGTLYAGNTQPLGVGGDSSGTYVLNGYIDDLRITKGYARYTSTFTPPTAAFPNIGPT